MLFIYSCGDGLFSVDRRVGGVINLHSTLRVLFVCLLWEWVLCGRRVSGVFNTLTGGVLSVVLGRVSFGSELLAFERCLYDPSNWGGVISLILSI